ncbi:MAG: NAD-dependent DNA ligase LigA [Planctomycetes bacterium]|nr:NAD-dependent DNA ligase LigA [Planctomycetota bacterium]
MSDSILQIMDSLRREIRRHDELYYQQAKPEISDQDYDELLRRLTDLERAHPEFITPDSPTQRVGGKPLQSFASVRHAMAMISIDNTYSEGEVREFDQRIRKLLEGDDYSYVCEPKIDGVSLSLRYENGLLVQAATRGDGDTGDDVTQNARTIHDIPLRLHDPKPIIRDVDFPGTFPPVLEVRGETFLTRQQFLVINQRQEAMGEELYANPRNTAAGTLKLLDPRQVAERKLRFLPHGQGVVENYEFATYQQWLRYLKAVGFPVSEYVHPAQDIAAVLEYIHYLDTLRKNLPYDTDGVVVKLDSLAQRRRLGATARAPRWCIAFKYQPEQAETQLARVVFQVGKTGTITPVAEFEPPVFISGTQVYRASLHNFDEIALKDIRLHDRVIVQKAGEVIPYVVGSVPAKRPENAVPIVPPPICPSCALPTVRDGGFVRCGNLACPAQREERLLFFGARDQMDIENLGPAVVQQLMARGLVTTIPDLYRLKLEDAAGLERMGEKSAANLITAIADSKNRGLERLLAGLGILHVGVRTAEDIACQFPSVEALAGASFADFEKVEGVGEVVAQSLHHYLHQQGGLELLRELEGLGVKTTPARERHNNGPLAGQTVVVTGKLQHYARHEINTLIASLGGKAGETVSKNTTLVVVGEDAGGKLEKARKLGVEIIDEAEFLKRIGKRAL